MVQPPVQGANTHAVGRPDDIVDAGDGKRLDGRDIVRPSQGESQPLRAMVPAVIVLWDVGRAAGLTKSLAHVEEHVRSVVALREQRDVRERLERGSGLAPRTVDGDVELTIDAVIPVVEAADQSEYLARRRTEGHDRGIADIVIPSNLLRAERREVLRGMATIFYGLLDDDVFVLAGEAADMSLSHALRLFLHIQVNGGVDPQATAIERLGTDLGHEFQLLANIHSEMRGFHVEAVKRLLLRQIPGLLFRRGGLVQRNVPIADHRVEHQSLSHPRHLGVIEGVDARGLRDCDQGCRLAQRKVTGALAEVDLSCRLNTVRQIAIEVRVQIPLQDLLLRISLGYAM